MIYGNDTAGGFERVITGDANLQEFSENLKRFFAEIALLSQLVDMCDLKTHPC